MMKYKILLTFLFLPYCAFGYYVNCPCCTKLQLAGWWGSLDYLFLWRKERFYPPLVTTNPTAAPTLAAPGTEILFGDEEVGGAPKSGIAGDGGVWVTCCAGLGGSFFILGEEEVDYKLEGSPSGFPIFGRPFFNTSTGLQDVDLLSFPLLQGNGRIEINTTNRLWGMDLYIRYRFLGSPCFKFDLLGGVLYDVINDNLDITSQTTGIGGLEIVDTADHFHCANNYFAGLVGLRAEWRSSSWAIHVVGKLGLGNMSKKVDIFGETATHSLGMAPTLTNAGLLAQPSNSGTHKNSKFEVVPQISANLQLKIWPHFWVTAGYTYIFYPAVALAGQQVDLNVNPTQVPGPAVGPISPFFHEHLKSFWVQGITAGIYICF